MSDCVTAAFLKYALIRSWFHVLKPRKSRNFLGGFYQPGKPLPVFVREEIVDLQGPKLRLTGRQCDQKLSVGDQSSKTGRQQAIILLSPWHLKFQGKRAFLKRKQKTPVDNCS